MTIHHIEPQFVVDSTINLGKLQYITNLNLKAMNGDDFPKINHDSRENRVRSWSNLSRIYRNDNPMVYSHSC